MRSRCAPMCCESSLRAAISCKVQRLKSLAITGAAIGSSNRYRAPVSLSDRTRCRQDAPSPPAGRAAAAVTELKPRGQQAPCSAAGRAGTQLPCCAQLVSGEAHSINERAVRHTLHSSMAILHPRAPCPTLLGVAAMCEVRLILHAALREVLGRRQQRRRFSGSKFAARQTVEHARMRQMPSGAARDLSASGWRH